MSRLFWLVPALAVSVWLAGCSSSTGPSEAETLDDYWIEGYYAHYTTQPRDIEWLPCAVFVRSGGPTGDPVSGLSVLCNGEALSFSQSGYYGSPAGIVPGDDVTFQVSQGGRLVSLTLEVPAAPSNLVLQEGIWDFSSPSGTHTLTWDNPGVVADSVLVSVAGQGNHPYNVFSYAERLAAVESSATLSNADMVGFGGATTVSCVVAQGRRGSFSGHSGGSEMWTRAGVIGDWGR